MPQGINKRPRISKRSKTGCSECRRRKIKCDEEQPYCSQCLKRGRTCTLQDSQFKHVFLAQQGASHSDTAAKGSTASTSSTVRNGIDPIDVGIERATRSLSPKSNSSSVLPAHRQGNLVPESSEVLRSKQEELYLLRHYAECIAPCLGRWAARSPAPPVPTLRRLPLRLTRAHFGSITPTDAASDYVYPSVSLSQGNLMIQADREDPVVRLLATCILIQYEQLSTSRDAWSGHLTGFSKLLYLIGDEILLRPNPRFQAVYPFTKDVMHIKAGFWNFVVNDLEESFVSHTQTRIDTENLALWRNMGLLIEDDGSLTTEGTPNSLSITPEYARDKALSYSLIRLMCKLMNFLAPSAQRESHMQQLSSSKLENRKKAFISLEKQFEQWYKSLSLSFHADGTFLTEKDGEHTVPTLFRRELWYSSDLCSAMLLYYHMARILLLIHRPRDLLPPSTETIAPFDLLHMLRDMEQRLQLHVSEIFSIVRAKPSDAIRLRAIQPIYVAGRCCTSTRDRRLLILTLRGVEDEVGVATECRVESLLREWNVSHETLGLEPRPRATEHLA
ncbi:hypothetical protein O1611_g7548 [Lasiodiplodia mahajangana]|uniref:Uncharacterized protein n=1 Tax=Lasiodiplodia mahajangana TaxID=1108764 RepID=A0ACC2JF36_9PEZI|nr:hypothetical protein O1611_g7548 [Lasiodiplodia mahajangana]